MTRRPIKFRLRQDNAIVGYEKWYPGQREGGKEYGDFKAFPEWLYSVDGENWFPARTNPIQTWWNNKDESAGLTDKNGKEIWEGDILKSGREYNDYTGLNSDIYGGNVYEVKSNGWRFYLEPTPLYGVDFPTVEVIGNIYENPDLLKQ